MADGSRLSARSWIPETANHHPVAAIIEYHPYGKSRATAISDACRYRYLAGFGYACIRVDIRGTGDSEGLITDEYTHQELMDGIELIAWVGNQPWCSGAVGLTGISWSGFNALQIAALRPPGLKAIISCCSSDNRYADDVHYLGGTVLAGDMLPWATTLQSICAQPPDASTLGADWQEQWLNRLENLPHFVEHWLSHPLRDAYWQHGSVCEDYSGIECPTFLVGGWADGYTNSILRLLENLSSPNLGIIGPWAHNWPDTASPGPAIGFLKEALRWWDYWLKGEDTGIMDEPQLRYWLAGPTSSSIAPQAGGWVAESCWPVREPTVVELAINQHGLASAPAEVTPVTIQADLGHGLNAGVWCPFGLSAQLPGSQNHDDETSQCFDSDALTKSLTILGNPSVDIEVASNKPFGHLVIRLCAIGPDKVSTLISRTAHNLNHSMDHSEHAILKPGVFKKLRINLDACASKVPAGHRLRLALSSSYWPLVWPTPETARLSIRSGSARLTLPLADSAVYERAFEQPEYARSLDYEVLQRPEFARSSDLQSGRYEVNQHSGTGRIRLPGGVESSSTSRDSYFLDRAGPLNCKVISRRSAEVSQSAGLSNTEIRSEMSADGIHFFVSTHLSVSFEGESFFTRQWDFKAARLDC